MFGYHKHVHVQSAYVATFSYVNDLKHVTWHNTQSHRFATSADEHPVAHKSKTVSHKTKNKMWEKGSDVKSEATNP